MASRFPVSVLDFGDGRPYQQGIRDGRVQAQKAVPLENYQVVHNLSWTSPNADIQESSTQEGSAVQIYTKEACHDAAITDNEVGEENTAVEDSSIRITRSMARHEPAADGSSQESSAMPTDTEEVYHDAAITDNEVDEEYMAFEQIDDEDPDSDELSSRSRLQRELEEATLTAQVTVPHPSPNATSLYMSVLTNVQQVLEGVFLETSMELVTPKSKNLRHDSLEILLNFPVLRNYNAHVVNRKTKANNWWQLEGRDPASPNVEIVALDVTTT
ncbi:hypothetical protein LX32DRAFT_650005 [Colletotrichum zoysiae]|uniref:Uncharacterized protein n=1 Tax=Colletotrichum zoysiae TaxID=1216348 RepID=A0AAD9HQ60_9PEZI|nr:hypothetical protein LX32DRAFT_650005 [Colletotrichum zoysiae]